MQCSSCGFENPQEMKYCGQCGTQLGSQCSSCGFESPPQFSYCGQCGGPLDRVPPPPNAPPVSPQQPVVPSESGAFPASQAFLSSLAPSETPEQQSSGGSALAIAVTMDAPGLKSVTNSLISNQIRQKVEWTFSEPEEVPGGKHRVIATGTAPLEAGVLTFKWRSTVAAAFDLSIDASQGQVHQWKMVPGSFQLLSPDESDGLRDQLDGGIENAKDRIRDLFNF